MSEKKKLVLIDGNSLMNRAFYALPPLMNKEGMYTNAIYGFTTMLLKIIDEQKPSHMSVAFDLKAPTFRHKAYSEYKGNRKGMPDELRAQVEPLKELLDSFGINRVELEGYEADDIIGTFSKIGEEDGFEVIIVTGDRDALQLASDNTTVLFTKKGITDVDVYDWNKVEEDYGVNPIEFIDLKGLMGDKSDNIPGVPGIGEKTGVKLIQEYKSLENVIANIENLKGSTKKKIEENQEIALLSKRLATIFRDIPFDMDMDDLKIKEKDEDKVLEMFNKYGFKTLISRISEIKSSDDNDQVLVEEVQPIKDISKEEILKKINTDKFAHIKFIAEKVDYKDRKVVLFGIMDNEGFVYFGKEEDVEDFRGILESEDIKKCGIDIKEDYLILRSYNILLKGMDFDMEIGEYLLEPGGKGKIEEFAQKYGRKDILTEEELLGKGKNKISISELTEETLKNQINGILNMVKAQSPKLKKKIEDLEMTNLLENIEMPLVEVLGFMEYEGFKADKEVLLQLQEEYDLKIKELEEIIYRIAGEEFNINSPKQLGLILFEKLNLPVIKKTKTGYSTNAEVLESLREQHEIIDYISAYRQVVKLKSTYVDGLLSLMTKDDRIHSSFNQTITATGRISSTDPNLQNIPVRQEMGRVLRKAFISKDEYTLVDADYSQIELRILAHMAEEDILIESFSKDEDIHSRTASEVFSTPLKEVTKEMRSAAKAVNFGIVYGVSDFGLAQNLNIPVKEAKGYIDLYFSRYPKIKEYMDNTILEAEEKGYVTTLLGRRRYIPEINSKNKILRSLGKRLAMNTPIQGTAADIIKIAMVKVFKRLKSEGMKTKLILQVHDELILEAPNDEVEKASLILKEEMESSLKLKVPMGVDVNVGKSWYETK